MMGAMRIRLPGPPPRRAGLAIFVLAILAVVVELSALGIRSSQLRVKASASASTVAPATVIPPTTLPPPTTVAPPTTVPRSPPSATTTTVAPPVLAPGSVTYTLPVRTRVTVAATGDCWVEARPQAGGPVLSVLTLSAGQSETFPAPVWLRLGDPDTVSVTAGSLVLQKPTDGSGDVIVQSP
jgi:hypothetical protein